MALEPGLDLAAIGAACDGFSAADLAALARRAALIAMSERIDAPLVTGAHFAAARRSVHPSLRAGQVAALERWSER